MRRYDMFLRTRGRTYPMFFIIFTFAFVQTAIIVFGIIINRGLVENFPQKFAETIKMDLAILIAPVLMNWKYFLDILFQSTEVFSGHLRLGTQVLTSKVEACDGAQWEMVEVTGRPKPQKFRIFSSRPKKFKIFRDRMEQLYQSKTLLSDMCEGVVTFRYMKRSKYIIEIIQMEDKS